MSESKTKMMCDSTVAPGGTFNRCVLDEGHQGWHRGTHYRWNPQGSEIQTWSEYHTRKAPASKPLPWMLRMWLGTCAVALASSIVALLCALMWAAIVQIVRSV